MPYQLLIFGSVLGYGIGAFFYKLAADRMSPLMVAATITLFYVLVVPLAFIFLKFDKSWSPLSISLSFLGALFTCVGSLGYLFALQNSSAGITTILVSTSPVITLLLSMFFLQETLTIKRIIGIILAMIGFAFLS